METKSLKDMPNNLGFMTKDGGSCLISPEDSKIIADFESGVHISDPEPISTEKRKEIEKKILSSIPEEDRKYLSNLLSKNHQDLDQSKENSIPTNSIRSSLKISDKYSFEIVDGKLVGYHGINDKIILVPHGVVTIGESVFDQANSESIKVIILPETVVNIEKYAFRGCYNLRYINFPSSLRKIGLRPFNNIEHLKYLYIPDEVMACDYLGMGLKLEILRLPLHLFNDTECISQTQLHTLVLGLPEEDGITPSQDKVDLRKIELLRSRPNIVLEPYVSSHQSKDINFSNNIFTVDGCMLLNDLEGRNYIPEDENEFGFTYVISIPKKSFVVPVEANVLDYKCGWYHQAPVLYIPSTIEFIAPDAFNGNEVFVTPAYNEQHLRQLLTNVRFSYQIITT